MNPSRAKMTSSDEDLSSARVGKPVKQRPAFVTPEYIEAQLAKKVRKQEERAEKRRRLGLPETPQQEPIFVPDDKYIRRELVGVNLGAQGQSVRILTYNILAQALIKHELFPYSDNEILRQRYRQPILRHEILSFYKPEILCMQEVDQFEEHWRTPLENSGYDMIYKCGPKKRHGCVIAWKRDLFESVDKPLVLVYDDHGVPFRHTGNIGILAPLKLKGHRKGLIIGTTHLYWHPRGYYERTRQGLLFLQNGWKLKSELGNDWSLVFAGDFNSQPNDPLYFLYTQPRPLYEKLPSDDIKALEVSMQMTEAIRQGEADDEIVLENHVVRDSEEEELQNLLPVKDIIEQYDALPECWSVYGRYFQRVDNENLYGDGSHSQSHGKTVSLVVGPDDHKLKQLTPSEVIGENEPRFSSYTGLWALMLDYIFVVNGNDKDIQVKSLLQMPREDQLKPGLPAMGRYPSDHICIMAELVVNSTKF